MLSSILAANVIPQTTAEVAPMSCARLCSRGGVQLLCVRSLSSCSASPAGDRPDGSVSCACCSPQAVLWMVHVAGWPVLMVASSAGMSGFSKRLRCCLGLSTFESLALLRMLNEKDQASELDPSHSEMD